uniref:NADPH-dependent enoyl-acyl-carrier-protein reductase n=1 Tax=Vitiosangium cumulatum TaxID=1867796 RepID=A0A7D5BVC5_9BACT|nr:NADPH-dependent enoyl-acyl-carrier-protein reductase [Vitiosangium cumulatum]
MKNEDVAIVTGASRGIGRAIALRLAREGCAVVVNYAGNAQQATEVVQEITKAGGRALAVRADVSRPDEVKQLFDTAERTWGPVTVLVNNAGVMQPGTVPLADTDDALFERIISINLQGTFNTLREAARRMRAGSRIVNLSTSVVGTSYPGYGVYTASKAGVEAMTRVFAHELRGRDIRVNVVAPGPTASEMFFEGKSQELLDSIAKRAPLERLGTPEETAHVVAFLVGEESAWVNGQILRVNGGLI